MESYNVAARPIFGSIQPISLKLQLGLYQARCGNQPFRLEMPSCDIAHRPFDDKFPVRREMGIVPIPVLLDVVKVRPRFACPKRLRREPETQQPPRWFVGYRAAASGFPRSSANRGLRKAHRACCKIWVPAVRSLGRHVAKHFASGVETERRVGKEVVNELKPWLGGFDTTSANSRDASVLEMLGFVYPATLCVATPGRRLDRSCRVHIEPHRKPLFIREPCFALFFA